MVAQLPAGETVSALGINVDKEKTHVIEITRREVGVKDVRVQIQYCGICHSDLHFLRQEWGSTKLPAVPGHEIVGIVTNIGSEVSKYKIGDTVGVGCFVDSCRTCDYCSQDSVPYCKEGATATYGSDINDTVGHTLGGYSEAIVVDESFVLSIPKNLDYAAVAPLLCAGITVWSPMKHYGVKAGSHVAILGLGGLGHMAVKLAVALGAKVTVLSRSSGRIEDAYRLGASNVVITSDKEAFAAAANTVDFIIDTVSADHDVNSLTNLLKPDGTIILLGASPSLTISPFSLIMKRIKLGGSLVGGIKETQELLDFCGKHNITSDIELVGVEKIEKAFERILKSDVKFRFVLDIAGTLNKNVIVE
ncbi:hypothetical protein HK100_010315 [Physocladia obscura]|uniref:Enoyl reductase (ER) domain-containing protein n=1 Tax=Physocladia obscura TaxID=109957 RepID=A0AAD5T4A0_9FUNG|nr:hypothetical protein HK100_010315 [Physocladia obscura]